MVPLLIALACAPKPAARSAEVAAPETQDVNWEQAALRMHMSEHFTKAQAARNAVIAGHLDEARGSLTWLATHEATDVAPVEYGQWLSDMRVVAQTGAEAKDIEAMAACVSGLANNCGGCHQAMNVKPSMPVNAEAPVNTGGLKGHMARHGWVADRMWVALAGPDEQAWADAVGALRDPPMSVYDLGIDEAAIEQVAPYADALNALSTKALAEADAAERAAIFGQVVETCASCHAVVSPAAQPMPGAPEPTPMPEGTDEGGDAAPTGMPRE